MVILALLSVSVFFTTSGALFQSRVASPMKELVLRLEDPCSINLPFVTPLVVLESIGVDCLIILIGNFGILQAFQISVNLILY